MPEGAPPNTPPAPELAIVLPVYNEGEAVEPVLRALSAAVSSPHELVVVYDFEEDSTVPVVARLAPEIPGLRGLRNDLGRGVLNAMKSGIAGTTAPYLLISMADGSDEPHVVDQLVAHARDGADVVAASRYMRGGGQVGGPLFKRLMSRTAGLTLHWFAGVPTHDPTNNFKLYSRRFLDSVTIESAAGFELALELTVKATLHGPQGRRGPDDVARSDRRPEQLQAPQVAAPLPPLVPGRVHGPPAPPRRAEADPGLGRRRTRDLGAFDQPTTGLGEDVRRDRLDGARDERVADR